MKKNLGKADKFIRVLLALVIGFLYYKGIISGVLGIVLIALALIFVLTSLVSFCPIYALFGINTCKKK
ncbi:MAG TPA: DUF2892 domain-containing protein [Niabella sp.]|jgi:uncharacterized membrane protein|nr:DUF2892 domain-containing protein [Chitinophagaceae bacterium]HRN47042.1 DUF2892 domain-containing protein [Niabella sp.]HRO84699.1 DUF2892 domain-containing protein [Niabella sp.]HUN03904.1 DUF2892 domain-containing protein [Niabella sp.]